MNAFTMPTAPAIRRSARLLACKSASPAARATDVPNDLETPISYAANLRTVVATARDEKRASKMSAYLRHRYKCFGVQTPMRRSLTRNLLRQLRTTSPLFILDVVDVLWQYDERECQYVAMDLLEESRLVWPNADFQLVNTRLQRCITIHSWWDTIDILATHAVLDAFHAYPQRMYAVLQQWAVHNDMWLRRVAILWQLRRKGETDVELLFSTVKLNMADDRFFIRKAIGWILRHYRRTDADAVDHFVEENIDKLSKLSVREAWKHK